MLPPCPIGSLVLEPDCPPDCPPDCLDAATAAGVRHGPRWARHGTATARPRAAIEHDEDRRASSEPPREPGGAGRAEECAHGTRSAQPWRSGLQLVQIPALTGCVDAALQIISGPT